jgi:hypothetical protein
MSIMQGAVAVYVYRVLSAAAELVMLYEDRMTVGIPSAPRLVLPCSFSDSEKDWEEFIINSFLALITNYLLLAVHNLRSDFQK